MSAAVPAPAERHFKEQTQSPGGFAFKEIAMQKILPVIGIAAALGCSAPAGAQQNQPFCLRAVDGQLTCHFETMAQCQEALKKGPTRTGTCIPNPQTKR
jgi:hypothetical protein